MRGEAESTAVRGGKAMQGSENGMLVQFNSMENVVKNIETERLILRTWRTSDLPPFSAMNGDPAVMEYFPNTLAPEESEALFTRITGFLRENGYGLLAVETKQSGEFAGFIGFSRPSFTAYFTPCIEIGWRLRREFWNMGYATEGAKACLDFGLMVLGFQEIYSWTAVINTKSVNVMRKIGMSYEAEFEHPNIPPGNRLRPHVLYRVSRDG